MELQEPLPPRAAISYLPSWSYFKQNKSVDHSYFFSYKELKKATNNFKTELGRGGYGSVFLAKLRDKRTVAVKVLKERTQKSFQQFNNEVKLLSRLQHKNLVAFYGCTKPDEELLLVYEYVPNRNLAYHLHLQRLPFPWTKRIQIAIEIAEGISYLHSLTPPIIHRDVKPDNILLDHAFHVKVADFGLCRLLPWDNKDVFTVTPGTAGYQDPEFKRVFRVTDKSDVYSFGVVLLELVSRQKAVDVDRGPDKIYLDEIALKMIQNKELEKLIDPEIGYSDDNVKRIIDSVVELACECLKPKGDMRPPMAEVLRVLKKIDGEMEDLPVFDEMNNDIQLTLDNSDLIDFLNELRSELPLVFTYNELKKATNSFDTSRLLGQGGFGRTYCGKLTDGRMVAVKVLFDANPRRLEVFIQQVMILSRLRHKNLIALYGCTFPHDEKLLVVYEFVPEGTVSDHLHGNHSDLSWAVRIRIATETAEALQYLHELAPPVIHCDVKTSNIMLDTSLHVKVADLASPGLLPWDTTHALVAPQGTIGYRDPEYDRTLRFNVKSDVYSFGVVLLEIISGKEAIDVHRDTEEIYLVDMALNKITHKKLEEFVDPKLGYQSDNDVTRMIDSVAELAHECLQSRGDGRPPIVEVLKVLKGIQDGNN